MALTTASPLQRALCRITQGLPLGDLATHPDVIESLGGEAAVSILVPGSFRPREVIVLAGIRTGKSLFTAACAIYASQTVDIAGLRPGEVPRVSVLSLTKAHATVVLNHILGALNASPLLKLLIVGEPKAESVFLRHPSGFLVEITVVPVDRAGGSVVARWSAGCILDEAPRLQSQQDGIMNYDDVRNAVLERLRPGASLISVGSPWAPRGTIFNRFQDRFGKPGEDLVVVRASGPALNPYWWTPERVEKAKKNPIIYKTDVLGMFADPDSTLFTSDIVTKCTRKSKDELPHKDANEYVATMDPATRGNAWTFVIVTKEDGIRKVCVARQWQGSRGVPLDPEKVMAEIAGICKRYYLDWVATDQWSSDALAAIARRYGLSLSINTMTRDRRYEMFDLLHKEMQALKVELPNDDVLKGDLMAIRKTVTQAGLDIRLPRTGDGRHADFALALVLSMRYALDDPKEVLSRDEIQAERREEARRKIFEKAPEKPWWEGP